MRKKEKQLNKLMWQMTAGEFLDLLKECIKSDTPKMELRPIAPKKEQRFVHGIQGIAGLFNCSLATANRIKSSGKIDEAITQNDLAGSKKLYNFFDSVFAIGKSAQDGKSRSGTAGTNMTATMWQCLKLPKPAPSSGSFPKDSLPSGHI